MKAENLIDQTKGRIFRATFIKNDGSLRRMLARTGVQKNLKGGRATSLSNPRNRVVWDLQKGAYRTIPGERTLEIKANGKTHQFGILKEE